ncbi:hypothetical protein OUZ56_012042 [Daphnia magna]|uniref:Uncharacterized protein n=1 Tax=Daphnia magna TaxID=35525 RepID=A0ABQ9Z1V9_9CRUS|nr:hypothetical protein OUZ56_012042 [Daphnia magna]
MQRLILLTSCKQDHHSALYELSSEHHETVATLQALKQADKLSYGTTLEQVSCKLPPNVEAMGQGLRSRGDQKPISIIKING